MCSPEIVNNLSGGRGAVAPQTSPSGGFDPNANRDKSLSPSPRSILDGPTQTNTNTASGLIGGNTGWDANSFQNTGISGGNEDPFIKNPIPRQNYSGIDSNQAVVGTIEEQNAYNNGFGTYTERDPGYPGKSEDLVAAMLNPNYAETLVGKVPDVGDPTKARYEEDKRVKGFRGFGSTILTSGLGITGKANSRQLSLIGS